jgi:predicted metal-binding protein
MDRSDPAGKTAEHPAIDRQAETRDDIVVSVCTTCRADSATPATEGPALLAALREALVSADVPARARAVQCLGVCKRPVTVAVSGADRYTFLFGDLDVARGLQALLDFVRAYRVSNYGLVPWRSRAEVLRKGMVARLPPAIWSPDAGEPPT